MREDMLDGRSNLRFPRVGDPRALRHRLALGLLAVNDPQTLDHYRSQVRAYLDMTGAERGLIVLMTTGAIITVSPSGEAMAA